MPSSRHQRVSESTFAIRTVHGSAERTRTPMVCCGSTFRRELIWPDTTSVNFRRSPMRSTTAPGKCTVGELQRKCLPNRYTRPHGTLLRRPVESAHLCVGVLVQHRQAYAPPRAGPSNRVRGHETTLNTVPTDRSHTNDTVCIRLGMVHSAR